MDETSVVIREVTAADTKPIRLTMLRTGTPSSSVDFTGDDDPATVHLGAEVDDRLVGVSSWLRTEDSDGVARVQLRAMAVLDDLQGFGVGAKIVAEGIRRAREAGVAEVWANARDSALQFYERCGFTVEGDGFVTRDTGLPHHVIRMRL
jgi:GNAT superfamily N-acetyltransferase